MLTHPRMFFDHAALQARCKALQAEGKRLVFTNGCYDLLHPGHVDLLARARALGDVLLLGLNTDASVKRLDKGSERPFNSLEARAFVAAHLASVDMVTFFDEDTPYELIDRIQPDVLVKGGDWPVERIVGADIVRARGGQVYSLPLVDGFSTTNLAEKILHSAQK